MLPQVYEKLLYFLLNYWNVINSIRDSTDILFAKDHVPVQVVFREIITGIDPKKASIEALNHVSLIIVLRLL